MPEKRITVWVQRFNDRSTLMLQWIDPDTGKRKSQTAGTSDPQEAEGKRKDLEYQLTHGLYQEASRMTWERFRELFEEEHFPNCRPATQSVFHKTFDWFEQLCTPKALRSITERTLSAFVSGLRKAPGRRPGERMQPSSIRVLVQYLRTALRWAEAQKLLAKVPTFPAVKVPKRKPSPVAAESFERLLTKADDPQMRAYLLCGWLAGLRRNEALRLEWEAARDMPYLDLARSRIVLPAEFVKAVEDQWVPLDPELREALEALPRHGKKVFRFVSRTYGGPLGDSALSHRISALARRAGVKLSMHTLRKGFGCRYAGKVSAHVLQRLMRHANIATTMDYYANIDAAVEEAILGPQRNGMRNNAGSGATEHGLGVDPTHERGTTNDE